MNILLEIINSFKFSQTVTMYAITKISSRKLIFNCYSKELAKLQSLSNIHLVCYLRLMATKYNDTLTTVQTAPTNGISCDTPECVDEQVNTASNIARCRYYMTQKNRFCRMLPIPNTQYCGLHLASAEGASQGKYKRVPCPYDPNHSVYAYKLEGHLAKCNARPKPRPGHYVEGVNSGLAGHVPCLEETYKLTAFPEEYLKNLITRVEDLYWSYVKSIKDGYLTHLSMKSELKSDKNGEPARKHLTQQASLISHIHLSIPSCHNLTFVEFGAGRGKLSHWVEKSLSKSALHSEFILVDRASFRHTVDSYHRSPDGPIFRRLFIDIEHLCLPKVDGMGSDRSVVGYCKHLCGGATDLAMNCLITTLRFTGLTPDIPIPPSALVMAPCCHHMCTWSAYVGRKFFETQLNLTSVDFHAIALMTSWKTCCFRPKMEKPQDSSLPIKEWNSSYMEDIGYKCKRLIDTGRVWWLRENGMETQLLKYVPEHITLENVVIIATPKN